MSTMEYWDGEARKVELPENTTWEEAIDILEKDEGFEISRGCSEEFRYIETKGYVSRREQKPFPTILNGEIYIIENYRYSWDEDPEGFSVYDVANGNIGFSGSFYNGGTDLGEMLENALKDHKSVKTIYQKSYCGEDLADMGNELYEYMDEICKGIPDDQGIPLGKFNLTITWEE